jgi:recombination protein RecR
LLGDYLEDFKMDQLNSLEQLIDSLRRLPGVGYKSAERMAYALLNFSQDDLDALSKQIKEIKTRIHPCPICGIYTENKICSICADNERTSDTVILVTNQKDINGFEQLANYRGRYHVLGGLLGPTSTTKPEDLALDSLIERIKNEHIKELIIATSPTIEGETTALYIAKMLSNLPVKITRIGFGVSMGSQLDYLDSITLYKSLEGRTEIK